MQPEGALVLGLDGRALELPEPLRVTVNRRLGALHLGLQLLALFVELRCLSLHELDVSAHAVLLVAQILQPLPHFRYVCPQRVRLAFLLSALVQEALQLALQLQPRALVCAGGIGGVEGTAELVVLGVELRQRVLQRPDLLLRFLDLRIEHVPLLLQLLPLLCAQNDVVGRALALFFSTHLGAHFVDEEVVFLLEGCGLHLSVPQLHHHGVESLLRHFEVGAEQLAVGVDLDAPLLHRLLQLELAVLERVHLVSAVVEAVAELLDLEAQEVVRDDGLLLGLDAVAQRARHHLVLQLQLVRLVVERRLLLVQLVHLPLRRAVVVVDLLELLLEHALLLLRAAQQLLQLIHLCVQRLLLVRPVLALGARDLALHLLQLEVGVVDVLLLLLRVRVQLPDLVAQVAVRALCS
mmetsp:Transcript_39581/g.93702  ORF Transcript_39581/g.93702 Transcript_39581/m.93702 type:complete len:408 (-) Transcript_39581:1417-2640(-)